MLSLLITKYFHFRSLNSSHNYEPHNVVKTIFPVKYPIFLRRISFDGRLALQNQLSPHNAWMRYPVYRRWYILPSLMKHQVNIVWNIVPLGSCQLYCTCRKKKQSEKETYLHLVFVWPEEGLGGKSHCVFDCWTNIITFNKEIERILDFGYL